MKTKTEFHIIKILFGTSKILWDYHTCPWFCQAMCTKIMAPCLKNNIPHIFLVLQSQNLVQTQLHWEYKMIIHDYSYILYERLGCVCSESESVPGCRLFDTL